ncbi:glycosyltransferase family 4 protein [Pseudoalteromonas haloplanktis]|uniref:Glycosyltransferase family 4 protein n=1 Tax=Pseudoalteromonas haloplanktis TaxID=228 RepID=A0ABU1BIG3_PSEHA|nr:glycosyltransferase family 4 protein [Pseudoalteromonas haloplanktis]MDQ9094037.1 glycosyltransferase family 4 protein [Pseudoalteromonas haloplanktis]
MNILYFHQHFSTPSGSTGIRSYEMAQRLLKHNHQVTMVCGSYGGGETGLSTDFVKGRREGVVDGIHIIEFDLAYSNSDGLVKRAGTFLKFALKSIGIALTHKYDVVFATTTPLTAGIPGIFARWLRGKPFVFEVRDLWPELPKEMGVITNPLVLAAMSALEWCSYRSAHRCIGLSPGIVEGIKKRGVKASKVEIVPNGCDLTIFADEITAWRPDGVADTDLMAVFTGTHGQANGLDAALDAAIELKKRGRDDIKLVLVGQGKLKESLQARAKLEKLDNVIFHPPVNKSKLAELMKGADIGLQLLANIPAFYYGTSPNKFFDYISAGLPVLNNYPGWLAGMINDNNCGYAIEPDNAQAFADALENAADNKESLPEMGQRAQALAKRDFNRHNLADKWVTWVTGAAK